MDILIGTTNAGKRREVTTVLSKLPLQFIYLASFTTWPKVVENGKSFEENALKKARTLADFSGYVTLADDSGLEVNVLGGAPGVYSARYGGEEGNDDKNNELLLRELAGVPQDKRDARFVCVIALCVPQALGGREWLFRGECEGRIAFAPKGERGFGYDPLFIYSPMGLTFAELDPETKNQVSHRGKALRKLTEELPSHIPLGDKP
ncbi:MAG: XTP/dITP diphosphatase [Deltaproteobacteria bacterium]|nr:XTP/dITP diphosphatase [Deltaproteobacteria bacterium]